MLAKRLFYRILVLLSLSFPLYYLVGAMQYALRSWELKRIGIVTSGNILKSEQYLVDDDDGDYYVYCYTVSYQDELDFPYRAQLSKTKDFYTEGSAIPLIYHPKTPKEVQLYKPHELTWLPIWNFIGTAVLWYIIMHTWFKGFLYPVVGENLGL